MHDARAIGVDATRETSKITRNRRLQVAIPQILAQTRGLWRGRRSGNVKGRPARGFSRKNLLFESAFKLARTLIGVVCARLSFGCHRERATREETRCCF